MAQSLQTTATTLNLYILDYIESIIPVFVYKGVEGQTITPAGSEVPHIDIGVACGLHLAPQQ